MRHGHFTISADVTQINYKGSTHSSSSSSTRSLVIVIHKCTQMVNTNPPVPGNSSTMHHIKTQYNSRMCTAIVLRRWGFVVDCHRSVLQESLASNEVCRSFGENGQYTYIIRTGITPKDLQQQMWMPCLEDVCCQSVHKLRTSST